MMSRVLNCQKKHRPPKPFENNGPLYARIILPRFAIPKPCCAES